MKYSMECREHVKPFFILLIVFFTFGTLNETVNCFDVKSEFNYGQVLQNALVTLKTDISFKCCMQECSRMDFCKSLNYFPWLKLCEINHKKKDDANTSMQVRTGAIYVEYGRWMKGMVCEDNTLRHVVNPPVILTDEQSYSVLYGDEATLACSIYSTVNLSTIYWEYSNEMGSVVTLQASYWGYDENTTSYTSTLTIVSSTIGNKGTYRGIAGNSGGTAVSKLMALSVLQNKPTVSIPISEYNNVTPGSIITIPCSINAFPNVTSMVWTHDTVKVENSSRFTIGPIDDPVLTIHNVHTEDRGWYKCSATNAIGTGHSSDIAINILTRCGPCPLSYDCLMDEKTIACLRYITSSSEEKKSYFEEQCANDGAKLIRIDSDAKQNIAEKILSYVYGTHVWIQGKYDHETWKFDDGSAMLYSNWRVSSNKSNTNVESVIMLKENQFQWLAVDKISFNSRDVVGALCEFISID